MHLYQNSEVIYSAESLEECNRIFTEDMGETPAEMGDEFEQIPDDQVLDVGSEDPSGDEREEARPMKNGKGVVVTIWYYNKKTAAAWAEEFGSGHFSGGDY